MDSYPDLSDIHNQIIDNGTAHLTYHATEMNDVIHPYSVPGYEYLNGGFVAFLDRFRTILPKDMPIVLEINGARFDKQQKQIIDKAIWMHYGLYLAEAAQNLKQTRIRVVLYLLFMILSSTLLFLVSDSTDEVIINYAYVLFWFFGYRLLIHLVLNYKPIYKEYQWYRRLSALKLVFWDDAEELPDADQIAEEESYYSKEADQLTKNHRFVEQVLLDESGLSLGCRITQLEDVVVASGAGNMEIVSDEMAEYLMSAVPFIQQKSVTTLTIEAPEGKNFTEEEQQRISSAVRNYLAFSIAEQDAERNDNKGISITFAIGLFISTILLFGIGQKVDLAVHEFILVAFWFFADYLLEFVVLSRKQIKHEKRKLETLMNMEISFQ